VAIVLIFVVPLLSGCGSAWTNDPPAISQFSVNGVSIGADEMVIGSTAAAGDPHLTVSPSAAIFGLCRASDKNDDPLTYTWLSPTGITADTTKTSKGVFVGTAGTTEGTFTLACTVDDGRGGVVERFARIKVFNAGLNHAPTAVLVPAKADVVVGNTQPFMCSATDADTGDTLTYQFFVQRGTIVQNATDKTKATYTAPATAGDDTVYCVVSDGKGAYVTAVATITVKAS
jgi:hypothetical protein